jgi:hypothetical protein
MAMAGFMEAYLYRYWEWYEKRPTLKRGGHQAMAAPRWITPQHGPCKINADGEVVKASSVTFDGLSHPLYLEALACQEAWR